MPDLTKSAKAAARRLLGVESSFRISKSHVQLSGQAASDRIRHLVDRGQPALVARFGSTELNCTLNYLLLSDANWLGRLGLRLGGCPYRRVFEPEVLGAMSTLSGFFPASESHARRFAELLLADIPDIDVLGSWLQQEQYVLDRLPSTCLRVDLEDLPPFHHSRPWSEALKGKSVLVVHPFKSTIERQYLNHRAQIFPGNPVLPEFSLQVLQPVQSIGADAARYIGTQRVHFASWFDALDHMTELMSRLEFDIAIFGCGAYGLPLAARAKRMGKIAVHLGGVTQCLFGIKGRRWETEYDYPQRFYNEHWVRPSADETPTEYKRVESGCYW